MMRPFQKGVDQLPSLIITVVIDQRVTQRSGHARYSG